MNGQAVKDVRIFFTSKTFKLDHNSTAFELEGELSVVNNDYNFEKGKLKTAEFI